jgi:hypothetical protein
VADEGGRDVLNDGLCSELRGQRHLFWFLRRPVVQSLCVSSRPSQTFERQFRAGSSPLPWPCEFLLVCKAKIPTGMEAYGIFPPFQK